MMMILLLLYAYCVGFLGIRKRCFLHFSLLITRLLPLSPPQFVNCNQKSKYSFSS
jgi:hypothetical protein